MINIEIQIWKTASEMHVAPRIVVHCCPFTLLLAPLLMVQILRTGGPDFQELLRVILTADITSGTHFSFSGTHFWLQYSSGTQFAQNYFGHDAQDLRIWSYIDSKVELWKIMILFGKTWKTSICVIFGMKYIRKHGQKILFRYNDHVHIQSIT